MSTTNDKTIRLTFMINVDLVNGGGMERTLLSYIQYMPSQIRKNFCIKIIQTGLLDRPRLEKDDIDQLLTSNNVELITLDNYNKNLVNLRISILSTAFNTITERVRNRKYQRYINKITQEADIVYLFHNAFSSFIGKGPIVIGSFHERNPNPKSYSKFSAIFIKLGIVGIKFKILWKRINFYHYQALNLKDYVPENSFYSPLGIDSDKFALNDYERSFDDVIRILFVGRLVKSKGIEILINAFKKIEKDETKYELHIVGTGDMEDYVKSLKSQKIIYHGKLGDEELVKVYNECDIFVFPSVSDIYGLVILEALATGEHVIVNDSLRGVFDEFEKLGVLEYSKYDTDDIANRILNFTKGNNRYNKDVIELIKKYDWGEIDRELYSIFRNLVK
jgi:glycosyltransferase involved in cell wall biosynthesis